MEERFVNLEIRISYQEDMIDELNKTIYRQQDRIDKLESMLQNLANRLTDKMSDRIELRHENTPYY